MPHVINARNNTQQAIKKAKCIPIMPTSLCAALPRFIKGNNMNCVRRVNMKQETITSRILTLYSRDSPKTIKPPIISPYPNKMANIL